jgi:mRNA turnover protein 4
LSDSSDFRYFGNYVKHDFGKAGTISQVDVILEPGPLPFNVSTLDQYRKLGLVVEVDNGVMMLREKFVAAEAGASLTPEQAKVLVHLDRKVDEFKLHLSCVWTNGQFEEMR